MQEKTTKNLTVFFDLDDTLYPNTSGLWEAIRDRMDEFMLTQMGFSAEEIPILRRHFYETYGTTLRGLQLNYDIDPEVFLHFVHDLPVQHYISPDPELGRILRGLPRKPWIFTNADSDHALRVLKTLELEDCFEGIIDIRALDFISKPHPKAYERAMGLAGEQDPTNCVILDDAVRNLLSAKSLGFLTVLVGADGSSAAVDISLNDIHQLPMRVPELWH